MKKLIVFSCLLCLTLSCGSSKSEEQEIKQRDCLDKIQVDKNQRYVDSIMKADMEASEKGKTTAE